MRIAQTSQQTSGLSRTLQEVSRGQCRSYQRRHMAQCINRRQVVYSIESHDCGLASNPQIEAVNQVYSKMQTLQSTRAEAQVARTRDAGMVMIIRNVPPDWAVPIGEALLAAEVDVMEITLNTPHALEMIAALRAALGEQMAIGAGTVLSVADAENARAAGAEFFVSPHLDTEIVRFANERDCMVVPGAFTPTEVFTALRAGAHIVKVFPANIVGPQFFKDLQGPFGRIPLLPTGGITTENAATYIQHGALALGVGAGLLNWQGLDARFERVTAATRALRAEIVRARQESEIG